MTNFEKGSLEANTKVTLYNVDGDEMNKEIYIYLQDLNDDGDFFFNVDYEIEYPDGSFENGNGMGTLDSILSAYGFEDYKKLSAYFQGMLDGDADAFGKIIADIKSKGVEISVDESVGIQGTNGFCLWG